MTSLDEIGALLGVEPSEIAAAKRMADQISAMTAREQRALAVDLIGSCSDYSLAFVLAHLLTARRLDKQGAH